MSPQDREDQLDAGLAVQKMARRMSPLRLSADDLRTMSDADILKLLRNGGSDGGALFAGQAAALSAELHDRSIKRGAKPHWNLTPTFVVAIISAVAGIVGAWYAYRSSQPQSGQPAAAAHAPDPPPHAPEKTASAAEPLSARSLPPTPAAAKTSTVEVPSRLRR